MPTAGARRRVGRGRRGPARADPWAPTGGAPRGSAGSSPPRRRSPSSAPAWSRCTGSTRRSGCCRRPTQTGFLDRFAGEAHLSALARLPRGVRTAAREARRRSTSSSASDAGARAREGPARVPGPRDRDGGAAPGETDELDASRSPGSRTPSGSSNWPPAAEGAAGGGRRRGRARRGRRRRSGAAAAGCGRRGTAERSAAHCAAEAGRAGARRARLPGTGPRRTPRGSQEVRERLAGARARCERKYGDGERACSAFLAEARARLAALDGAAEERRALEDEVAALTGRGRGDRAAVTGPAPRRRPRWPRPSARELPSWACRAPRSEVELRPAAEPGPGRAPSAPSCCSRRHGPAARRPLAKAASGGELSRDDAGLPERAGRPRRGADPGVRRGRRRHRGQAGLAVGPAPGAPGRRRARCSW